MSKRRVQLAFTMAEILLSLTIIGVVAAITLPSLTGNINERTWNTQRKALYARFSQALALMPSLNGYGTLIAEETDSSGSVTQSAVDTAAEAFLTDGLSKVLKINNICDYEHLQDCGIVDKITRLDGTVISDFTTSKGTLLGFNDIFSIDTKAAAFETQNGESIVVYYNPTCISENLKLDNVRPFMCANFVYDLNGSKGPNTVGKDIGFISALYPTDPEVVAPMPSNKLLYDKFLYNAGAECKKTFGDYRVPNLAEAAAITYNKDLIGGFNESNHKRIPTSTRGEASSYSGPEGGYYVVASTDGWRVVLSKGASITVRCVQRY